MKNFLTFVSAVIGFLAAVTAVAVVVDRLLYKNGSQTGYVSCECEEDEA